MMTCPIRFSHPYHPGRDRTERGEEAIPPYPAGRLRRREDSGGVRLCLQSKDQKGVVTDLATCLFIEKKEHVLIYGPAGVGKTHLAEALGHEACRRGYTTLFIKSAKILRSLFAARADQSWERQLKRFETGPPHYR